MARAADGYAQSTWGRTKREVTNGTILRGLQSGRTRALGTGRHRRTIVISDSVPLLGPGQASVGPKASLFWFPFPVPQCRQHVDQIDQILVNNLELVAARFAWIGVGG